MKFRSNLHGHTQFSDGKDTVQEMVQAAVDLEFLSIGISDHSFIESFDQSMRPEKMKAYLAEISRVKSKYEGEIEVYAGIEWDYYSNPEILKNCTFDYTVGSVHDVCIKGVFFSVDDTPEKIEAALEALNGSGQAFCEIYYETVLDLIENQCPTILGHVDLLKKLNADSRYFDEEAEWYKTLCEEVVEAISKKELVVEINTGGMARGYRSDPYPSDFMLQKMLEKNIPFTLSSDCHNAVYLDYSFEDTIKRLQNLGGKSLYQMEQNEWKEISL